MIDGLPKQTRSSGGQNKASVDRVQRKPAVPSKADPIFRGSKPSASWTTQATSCFQSRPDLQGVKTFGFNGHLRASSSSKADPIFRGSKHAQLGNGGAEFCGFQSRPDLQGVKTTVSADVSITSASKADPIFRGSKRHPPGALLALWCPSKADPIFRGSKRFLLRDQPAQGIPSKADPIFRGSKPVKESAKIRRRRLPKQTRSSGGQNLRSVSGSYRSSLPKQTRSSGGQNGCDKLREAEALDFQSRPDLQGVKTRRCANTCAETSKADPIFRGSKRASRG